MSKKNYAFTVFLMVVAIIILIIGIKLNTAYSETQIAKISLKLMAMELPAEGTSGTCTWTIDANGKLTIKPTSGTEGTLASMETDVNNTPWKDYSEDIKTIAFEGKVYGGESCSGLFRNLTNLTNIENLSNFDTSNVTNMQSMFAYCSSIKNLNLSSFDTSKVTNMTGMFASCSSVENINVSSFDTKNVTDMHLMFSNCQKLKALDLSSFNTSKVTNMKAMFNNCQSIKQLDLSNFNTSNVINMESIFSYMNSLVSLDISNFDTVKTENMYDMFPGDTLTQIKIGSKTNFKIGVNGVLAQAFGRGTWKREEDGKSYSIIQIYKNSANGSAAGTYKKLSDISNELIKNISAQSIVYKIEQITKIDKFETDRSDIFKNVDNKAILADISLRENNQLPGKIELTFNNVVTDKNKNKYNLKMIIDNISIKDKDTITDAIFQNIVDMSDNRINLYAGTRYNSIEDYKNNKKYEQPSASEFSEYDITMQIVDNSGNPVEGNYIFSIYDLDIPAEIDKDGTFPIPDGTKGYGKHSEGIELKSGFKMDTLQYSDNTFLMELENRITGTRMDNNSEFSELLVEADSKEVKFTWGAGDAASSHILSYYQPQFVEIVLQNTKGENLSGGKLQLFYGDILKQEYETPNTSVELFLMPGEYTLKEIQAPNGYELTKDITFYVDTNNKLTRDGNSVEKIIMINDQKTTGENTRR